MAPRVNRTNEIKNVFRSWNQRTYTTRCTRDDRELVRVFNCWNRERQEWTRPCQTPKPFRRQCSQPPHKPHGMEQMEKTRFRILVDRIFATNSPVNFGISETRAWRRKTFHGAGAGNGRRRNSLHRWEEIRWKSKNCVRFYGEKLSMRIMENVGK